MSPLPPGATLGILGGGQLGRMLALAARPLGYRVAVFSPENDSPAGQVADRSVVADYENLRAIRAFAPTVQVITFEFENVSALAPKAAAEFVPVRPGGHVLHVTQNRLREKTFLRDHGFPVADFRRVASLADLERAVSELGRPAVLKTAAFGYDGKGQVKIAAATDLAEAWSAQEAESVLEAFVDFEREVSVVAARSLDGQFASYPVFENRHSRHILDVTSCPANLTTEQAEAAERLARGILEALDVVGVLTVEMFLRRDGRLLINELAPRVHNSGHLTIDACVTSQFEQQARAVCGLPLGATQLRQPAAMANLLGDLWEKGEPNWPAALSDPGIKLHLYGKTEARPGRKMGHLTACADSVEEAVARVEEARRRLLGP